MPTHAHTTTITCPITSHVYRVTLNWREEWSNDETEITDEYIHVHNQTTDTTVLRLDDTDPDTVTFFHSVNLEYDSQILEWLQDRGTLPPDLVRLAKHVQDAEDDVVIAREKLRQIDETFVPIVTAVQHMLCTKDVDETLRELLDRINRRNFEKSQVYLTEHHLEYCKRQQANALRLTEYASDIAARLNHRNTTP
jgi:hypothetical protein